MIKELFWRNGDFTLDGAFIIGMAVVALMLAGGGIFYEAW